MGGTQRFVGRKSTVVVSGGRKEYDGGSGSVILDRPNATGRGHAIVGAMEDGRALRPISGGAAYTPAALVPAMTSLTSTAAYQTSTAANTGILRTIHAQANLASHNFTVSTGGADAAATRLIDQYALTQFVPAIFNGWWVVPATAASWLGYKCDTSAGSVVMLTIGGYIYS